MQGQGWNDSVIRRVQIPLCIHCLIQMIPTRVLSKTMLIKPAKKLIARKLSIIISSSLVFAGKTLTEQEYVSWSVLCLVELLGLAVD